MAPSDVRVTSLAPGKPIVAAKRFVRSGRDAGELQGVER
jgi:hypothetical protein